MPLELMQGKLRAEATVNIVDGRAVLKMDMGFYVGVV